MTDQLPSRERVAEAITFAHITESDGDLLQDIAQAYVEGRLVDREAIDDQRMKNTFISHALDQLDPPFSMTAIDAALDRALAAAIGDGDG